MATPKNKAQLEEENQSLKDSLDLLQKQMLQMQEMVKSNMSFNNIEQSKKDDRVSSDEMIPVKSNFEGTLVLVPEKSNPENEYRFEAFGETIDIPMDDLRKIVRAYKGTFCKSGYFTIEDDRVVKELRLKSSYEKVANSETIDSIINMDSKGFSIAYDELSRQQQETLLDRVLARKFRANDVSIEVLHILGSKIGMPIIDLENPRKGK